MKITQTGGFKVTGIKINKAAVELCHAVLFLCGAQMLIIEEISVPKIIADATGKTE